MLVEKFMGKIHIKKFGLVLSAFFVLGYIVDFFWAYTLSGRMQELYLDLLRISFLNFSGLDAVSFISALVQVYVWAWIIAIVFGWLWNRLATH